MTEQYYSVTLDENTLQHYGVKGMKWGVRRIKAAFNNLRQNRKLDRINNRRQKEWSRKYRNRSNLKTEELQRLTKRIRAENELRDALMASKKRSGFVKQGLQKFGSRTVEGVVSAGGKKLIKYALTKMNR